MGSDRDSRASRGPPIHFVLYHVFSTNSVCGLWEVHPLPGSQFLCLVIIAANTSRALN